MSTHRDTREETGFRGTKEDTSCDQALGVLYHTGECHDDTPANHDRGQP